MVSCWSATGQLLVSWNHFQEDLQCSVEGIYCPLKPLGSVVEVDKDVISGDAGEGNGKSNARVDRIRVQRQEDHEETRTAENHRDEERDLEGAGQIRFGVSEVDQTQDHHTDEQPAQKAHEV